MSAFGTFRTCRDFRVESAFGGKAEVGFRACQGQLLAAKWTFAKPPTSAKLASNCRLGLRVEDVKPGRAHGNAQLVAHLHPHGRLDARHYDTLADLHIEQDFRAE